MQHWCLARIKFCLFLYILFSHFLKITLSLREPSQSLNFTFTNQIYTILLDRQACPLSLTIFRPLNDGVVHHAKDHRAKLVAARRCSSPPYVFNPAKTNKNGDV